MHNLSPRPRLLPRAVALLACLVATLALLPTPAGAQGEDKPSVYLSTDRQQGGLPLEDYLLLRPNSDQEVYLWVKNPASDRKFFQVVIKGGEDELARLSFDVQAKSTLRIPLPKLAKAPVEEKKPEVPKPDDKKPDEKKPEAPAKIDLPEIKGTAPTLQLRLSETDKDGKVLTTAGKDPVATRKLTVLVMAPREYLEANAEYNADGQQTTVSVKGKPIFAGPPCPLTLNFRPDLLPGLKESSAQNGVFKQVIDRSGKEVRLVAQKIDFQGNPSVITRTGQIAVSADGYDRAFLFDANYDVGSGSRPFALSQQRTAIRIRGALADGSGRIQVVSRVADTFKVPLEVDNAPPNAWVELAIDRDRDDQFSEDETVKLPAPRDQHIYFIPYGPNSGLVFKTTVADWAPSLDTAGVLGEHAIRVRLMAPPIKPGDDPRTVAEVLGKLMFDNTPPDAIKFGEFPKSVGKGQRLTLKVTARDVESGIAQVNFYLGDLRDGKLPEGLPPIKASSPKEGEEYWTADIPVPDKKGEFTVIAQVTNRVGLVAVADTKVELVDPPPPTGKIKGKVVEDGRAKPKLEVILKSKNPKGPIDPKDPTKKEQDTWTTTTNEKGEFLFEEIPPGAYTVSSVSDTIKTHKGSKTVDVKAQKTTEVEVSLTK